MSYIDTIERYGACSPAVRWLRENNFPTLQDAWNACTNTSWLAWLLESVGQPVVPQETGSTDEFRANNKCPERLPLVARSLNTVVEHYAIAALWSSTGDDDKPLDDTHGNEDIHESCWQQFEKDCAAFLATIAEQGIDSSWWLDAQLGHDFWLTRNGHGIGFWDRGQGDAGDQLSKVAKAFGEVYIYVGDDGKIWGS